MAVATLRMALQPPSLRLPAQADARYASGWKICGKQILLVFAGAQHLER